VVEAQQLAQRARVHLFVVDHEHAEPGPTSARRGDNGPGADGAHRLVRRGELRILGGRWQEHVERRAATSGGVDLDGTAVVLHDALADRETEPRTEARRLGREERIEDPRQQLARDPTPGVADREPYTSVVGLGDRDADLVGVRRAVGDRVRRIDDQVEHDLQEPRLATEHQAIAGVVAYHPRALPDLVRRHRERRVGHRGQCDRLAHRVVGAREPSEPTDDLGDAARAVLRSAERGVERRAVGVVEGTHLGDPPSREGEARRHVGERVVDLVRDAAGERAERRELAADHQLLLQLPRLRDVLRRPHDLPRRTIRAAEHAHPARDPADAPRGEEETMLEVVLAALREHAIGEPLHLRAVVGVDRLVEPLERRRYILGELVDPPLLARPRDRIVGESVLPAADLGDLLDQVEHREPRRQALVARARDHRAHRGDEREEEHEHQRLRLASGQLPQHGDDGDVRARRRERDEERVPRPQA
jgi:hypothetical protein